MEKIVEEILSKHPEISRREILEKLKREKKKMGGLLSDEVLLRKIAAEFGVEDSKEVETPTLSIEDLISGLNDVSVAGRVVAVFPSRVFGGLEGGKVASFLIADRSGVLRVTLWNEKVDYVESGELKIGEITRVSHGYTKEGYRGKIELHVGERGEILIGLKNVDTADFPIIREFLMKISEIAAEHENERVHLAGVVEEVSPVSTFERKDSSCGRVMRLKLADETGMIPIVVWNRKVDEVEGKIERGTKIQLINAIVRRALGEGFEVHVDSVTYVETTERSEEIRKIADLEIGLENVKVEGEVVTEPILQEIKTSTGKLVKLAVFELEDETGRIWVSAWRRHAGPSSRLKTGQKVVIEDAYVKKGFGDKPELSTRKATSIIIRPNNRG